jgi:hypothetical protein
MVAVLAYTDRTRHGGDGNHPSDDITDSEQKHSALWLCKTCCCQANTCQLPCVSAHGAVFAYPAGGGMVEMATTHQMTSPTQKGKKKKKS